MTETVRITLIKSMQSNLLTKLITRWLILPFSFSVLNMLTACLIQTGQSWRETSSTTCGDTTGSSGLHYDTERQTGPNTSPRSDRPTACWEFSLKVRISNVSVVTMLTHVGTSQHLQPDAPPALRGWRQPTSCLQFTWNQNTPSHCVC